LESELREGWGVGNSSQLNWKKAQHSSVKREKKESTAKAREDQKAGTFDSSGKENQICRPKKSEENSFLAGLR